MDRWTGVDEGRTEESDTNDQPQSDPVTRSNHGRVLLVDDDERILELGLQALVPAGFDVVVATSAAQARAYLSGKRIDVAIIDYYLGAESGPALIASLRAHNPVIRIIVLTALGNDVMRYAYASGANDVDSKIRVDWLAVARGVPVPPPPPRATLDLDALQREALHGLYLVHHRNISRTARAVGMTRSSLQRLLHKILPADR